MVLCVIGHFTIYSVPKTVAQEDQHMHQKLSELQITEVLPLKNRLRDIMSGVTRYRGEVLDSLNMREPRFWTTRAEIVTVEVGRRLRRRPERPEELVAPAFAPFQTAYFSTS
jgi:hypothetical protein